MNIPPFTPLETPVMATVRGGNAGLAAALVIFGCGFVISLLVAIIFYTKIETHKAAEQAAKDDLSEYISGAETTQANDFKKPGATVFQNMLIAIRDFEADLREANDQIAKLKREANEMEAQYATLNGQKNAIEQASKAETQRYYETMEERKASVDDALSKNVALQDQVNDMQAKIEDYVKNADAAARDRIADLTEQVQAFEGRVFEATRQAEDQKRQYDQLLASLPKPPASNTTSPDGEVASVFGKGNDLFITLGKRDGLVVGMTFEVFDPQPVIRLSTTGQARGKATIEVYGLKDDAATCRVVRRDRNIILNPGDPVVNLGYDPNLTINMFAFGEFDIERDGGTNDLGRVEAIIKGTGAKLVKVSRGEDGIPILTPDINYVILGDKPEPPEKPSDVDFDPVKIAEYQAKLAATEAYFRIIEEAKLMRIPVLSQDRFLDLVGYYQR